MDEVELCVKLGMTMYLVILLSYAIVSQIYINVGTSLEPVHVGRFTLAAIWPFCCNVSPHRVRPRHLVKRQQFEQQSV